MPLIGTAAPDFPRSFGVPTSPDGFKNSLFQHGGWQEEVIGWACVCLFRHRGGLIQCRQRATRSQNAWSRGTAVQIPTGGVKINGMFFRGPGDTPHPTMIYFHGLPGFAGDLDLPLPVSRSGWNVLTLHYRGSWHSGNYSDAHQLEETAEGCH